MRRNRGGWAVAMWLGALSGCASTLSQMQTAKTLEPGHVQVDGAVGFYAPVGAVSTAIGQGVGQVAKISSAVATGQKYELTPDEASALVTAALALAVFPPAPTTELSARVGVLHHLEAGVRYSGSALRGDVKYQVFHHGDGDEVPSGQRRSVDLAVGLGVARYFFDNPATQLLEYVDLNDFSRWDFELPVYASWELGDVLRFYGGLKYVYSRTNLDPKLSSDAVTVSSVTGADLSIPTLVHSHFLGATVGAMVGYRYAFLAFEVTPGWTFCRPYVLGARRDLGGFTLFPAVGLVLRF